MCNTRARNPEFAHMRFFSEKMSQTIELLILNDDDLCFFFFFLFVINNQSISIFFTIPTDVNYMSTDLCAFTYKLISRSCLGSGIIALFACTNYAVESAGVRAESCSLRRVAYKT